MGQAADKLPYCRIAEVARDAAQAINPSDVSDIFSALEAIDVRKNIFHKVDNYLKPQVLIQNMTTENYNIYGGQQGAVGHGAQALQNTFDQLAQSIDESRLKELAAELSRLRVAMKENASAPEHDIEIGNVAQAESSASSGNKSKTLEFLTKAGKWTLDVAKSIAVPIATQLLEAKIGLPPS